MALNRLIERFGYFCGSILCPDGIIIFVFYKKLKLLTVENERISNVHMGRTNINLHSIKISGINYNMYKASIIACSAS